MGVRLFGEIDGYSVGSSFPDRAALRASGIHPPLIAGISGGGTEGANSIVLSGGYEDDLDFGDVIVYTGHGGNDPSSGKQVADQTLTAGNLALAVSCQEGLPVRVTRCARHRSEFSPKDGYRYDGLYRVDEYWSERGKSGFLIWRFRLERISDSRHAATLATPEGTAVPKRRPTTVQRIVRNTVVGQHIKALYDHRCQVCGIQLVTKAGPYSEAAHIRPLGQPHNGPDNPDNVLCLCPNHHILFDLGGLIVLPDLTIVELERNAEIGTLSVHSRHSLDPEALAYHHALFDR